MWKPPPKHEDQPDYCVLCGRKTEYCKETPILDRVGFIQGAGQFCADCHKSLYLKGRDSDG